MTSREYFVVVFAEPGGGESWAVQERVVDTARGYFLRHLVSFHPTMRDALTAREVAYRKTGVSRAPVAA